MIVTKEIGTHLPDTTMESPIYINVRKEPFSVSFEKAKEIIKKNSEKRKRSVPSTSALGSGLSEGDLGVEVTIGGAIVFTVDVEGVDKY